MTSRPAHDTKPLELTVTRLIDAPRTLVWQAWTDPEQAAHWGPEGFTIHVATADIAVRPGAPWRVRLRPDDGGPDLWQGGVYREVREPELLVFTFAWDGDDGKPGDEMQITVTLEDRAGKTLLTLHQIGFATVASRDGHGVGWGEALDQLGRHAAALHGRTAIRSSTDIEE